MNKSTSKLVVIALFILIGLVVPNFALEDDLRKALDRANSGDTRGAIEELRKLEGQAPGDARISLSLGLLYQSTDQIEEAIPRLEKAVALSPSTQGYYALGLLYEAKLLATKEDYWKGKALEAWGGCQRVTSSADPKYAVAVRHLQNLREQQPTK